MVPMVQDLPVSLHMSGSVAITAQSASCVLGIVHHLVTAYQIAIQVDKWGRVNVSCIYLLGR